MLYTIISTYIHSWFFGVSKKKILQTSELPKIEPFEIEIKKTTIIKWNSI
jgi:hypothetical protein